jgi:AhpD family alkylhydroperoxidase
LVAKTSIFVVKNVRDFLINMLCAIQIYEYMGKLVNEFNTYRERMNDRILASDNKVMKRIYSLDTLTYQHGALSSKVKEMLGLATSMVLRCDDCVKYHLGKCFELGVTTGEVFEIFSVANLVGGTIVIPHTRRAVEYWEELVESSQSQ